MSTLFKNMVVLICVLMMTSAFATTYYVDVNSGSNSNSGLSRTKAFATIQLGADKVVAGDSCIVLAGDYPKSTIYVSHSGTSSNPIVFAAEGTVKMGGFKLSANYVTVTGFEMSNNEIGVWVNGSYCSVLNNYIHNTTGPYGGIYIGYGEYDYPRDSPNYTNCTIRGNTVNYNNYCNLYITGQNHLIRANELSHPTSPDDDANSVTFFGAGHTFRGNHIHDIWETECPVAHRDAFQTWGPAYNMTFTNNFLDFGDSKGDNIQGFMIESMFSVYNLTFTNNVFVLYAETYTPATCIIRKSGQSAITNVVFSNNTCIGTHNMRYIFRAENCTGVQARNNIFHYTGTTSTSWVQPYWEVPSSTGLDIGNNIYYAADGKYASASEWENDIWGKESMFEDLSGGDFHLKAGSPAIDAGATLSGITTDKDGNLRPSGNAYDIGAYEYIVTGSAPNGPTDLKKKE